MAKKRRKRVLGSVDTAARGPGRRPTGAQADALGDFAEDLGRLLGTAESKARGWLDQRSAIADKLTQVRDSADQLLRQLSGSATGLAQGLARGVRRRGRPPGSKNTTKRAGRKKRPPMSAEARQRIADAQRKRWAKQKRAAKKTSGEGENA